MKYKILFFALLILTFSYLASLGDENTAPTPLSQTSLKTQVVRVVDGDTIVVIVNGLEEKVRIIGINTPESVDPRRPVECFGKEASKKATELLGGKDIVLENFQERDEHGRVLAYIKVDVDNQKVDFGEKMISEGYAYSFKSYSHERLPEYNILEKKARTEKVGLWADDVCEE